MKRIFALLLGLSLLLCAGCASARKVDGPESLPGDTDALVLLEAKAAGDAVVVIASAATFSADGTSFTYSEEIPYSFAVSHEAFQASLYDVDGNMRQYADGDSFCEAVAALNAEGKRPVCDYSFDQEGRLIALHTWTR